MNFLIRTTIADILGELEYGLPASDLVTKVREMLGVNDNDVSKQIRVLMERGVVVIGPGLNLILKGK